MPIADRTLLVNKDKYRILNYGVPIEQEVFLNESETTAKIM